MYLPIPRRLFSATDRSVQTTDIVMLLTPRIVRGHELTQQDVSPIHIGTDGNIGVTGPPPRIAAAPTAGADVPAPAANGGVGCRYGGSRGWAGAGRPAWLPHRPRG